MHVGSLILFEKPAGHKGSFYPAIRCHLESRLHHAGLDGPGGVALAQAELDIEAKPVSRGTYAKNRETKSAMPPSAAKMLSAAKQAAADKRVTSALSSRHKHA